MDLVNVKLNNTDAISSIRGVYGGVGATLSLVLAYLAFTNKQSGLQLLALLWGSYALSRTITILNEGALGAFGKQWLTIESFFFVIAVVLLLITRTKAATRSMNSPVVAR